MILIKTWRQWKTVALMKLQDEISSLVFSVGTLCLVAVAIWFAAPHISTFFILPEKRIDLILLIGLIWVLKYLMLDFDTPTPRHQLEKALQQRFEGALRFLQATTSPVSLNKLPWYLLIGP